MTATQLSVFIENRQGRLGEVLRVLKTNGVNILSMSLADTTEYGLLRLIVNNPEAGKVALTNEGFSSMTTEVMIIKIPHKAGALQEILEVVSSKNINVEYMYGLSIDGADASVVLLSNDLELAKQVFVENKIETLSMDVIAKL